METDRKWIVVRIDGKIAAVSTDYRKLAEISAQLAGVYGEITAVAEDFEEVWKLRQTVKWEDLMLFGTDFQKKVWKKLWELTHQENTEKLTDTENPKNSQNSSRPGLISYSDFAQLCENRAGVRAVAHAVGLNPVSVIIPCHLVVPKESIDKMTTIQKKAETTIFKGDDLCLNSILSDASIDFGEYSLGRELKRRFITIELTGQ
jgi:O6-methylguanine-DNA--protein-cysteine methyltransferase